MKSNGNISIAALMALTTVMTAIGIDGTLPSMPAMVEAFGVGQASVQLTLSLFMLGIAVGQLIHGPLSDRFGRKPVIVCGLLLNVIVTAGCAMATSVEQLMVLRFIHGISASTGWIVSRAVIRDRFERAAAARTLSLMLFFHSLAPLVSPIVGAHLTVAIGWNGMFIFIAAYSAVVTGILALCFRETLEKKNPDALRIAPMARNFLEISRSVPFWAYTLIASACYGILFSFLGASSYVIIGSFGRSETDFGYMFAGCMIGTMIGMLAGAWLVGRLGADRLLRGGVIWMTLFALVMAGLAWAGEYNWFALIAPMFFCMTAFSFMFPQSIAGALQPFPHIAGAASSLVGFVQQLIGAATGAIVAALSTDGTQTAIANGVLFWAVVALVTYFAVIRRHRTI